MLNRPKHQRQVAPGVVGESLLDVPVRDMRSPAFSKGRRRRAVSMQVGGGRKEHTPKQRYPLLNQSAAWKFNKRTPRG